MAHVAHGDTTVVWWAVSNKDNADWI